METTSQKEILKSHVAFWRKEGKNIGFVPTMGALHAGHISLVKAAKETCDIVVVSIFVNPLQFNNPADLEKYPRQPEADQAMVQAAGADLVYMPAATDFYEIKPGTTLDFGSVSQFLEGEKRPGHFSGVGIVVARLFHLVQPHKAFFGLKDLQQLAVIKTLVCDLGFDVEIVPCPTLREASGLAMSSRNERLTQMGRKTASAIYHALSIATSQAIGSGLQNSLHEARQWLRQVPGIEVEYLQWVNTETMEPILGEDQAAPKAICAAVWIEGVRLIDNRIM